MRYILTIKFQCDDEKTAYDLGHLAYSALTSGKFVPENRPSSWSVVIDEIAVNKVVPCQAE